MSRAKIRRRTIPIPGPLGSHSHGMLNQQDEGDLAVLFKIERGLVVMEFGKEISWIGLEPYKARQFADMLNQKAEEAERSGSPKTDPVA